ncbi:uncharacterized protein LOC128961211 [Oppia nitens]|uniref:uncharacterized protein LOC128961211 n=1 Tax=Oppia nitens TaxID=1686743 RepID=UPI0023DC7148|nr:uncharacterized protein LOC128961211 [Oppia nitens]
MPQEFVVLKCCHCDTYQIQQSKKSIKWLCKVCDQKQSVKQFYGRGSARECRLTVQSLNSVGHQQQLDFTTIGRCRDITMDTTQVVPNHDDIDAKILAAMLATYVTDDDDDVGNDSSDDSSSAKRLKLSSDEDNDNNNNDHHFDDRRQNGRLSDDDQRSLSTSTTTMSTAAAILWQNPSQLYGSRPVSKWSKFLK